jgi:hypothetical protein
VIGRPVHARALQGAVLALAIFAAATPVDEALHHFVFRHVVSHEVRMAANGFTLLGTTEVATVGLLGLAVLAHRAADAPMWQAAAGGVVGVLLAGLTTQVVKNIVCRARPRLVDGWGPRGSGSFTGRALGSLDIKASRRVMRPPHLRSARPSSDGRPLGAAGGSWSRRPASELRGSSSTLTSYRTF